MAISATFEANFSTFRAEVDRSVLKLRDLQTGSASVASALTRMGDSFSGRKILSDATLAVKAVHDLGGASKLTSGEQTRLNTMLSEAIAKYKALGQSAPKDMLALEQATRKVETAAGGVSTKMIAIGSAIGTFASGVALSAVRSLGAEFLTAAQNGAKFAALSRSFDQLTSSIGQSGEAMVAVTRGATKGLVSDLDIMQASNKAILLGLPVTADEMGKLSKAAVSLGRAMGQDATTSLNDLITALGRSSPLILDNLGLTVKVGEANEAYARKLNKTVGELTDAEKKMAFYTAAMASAVTKTEQLGEIQLTVTDQLSRLVVALGNVITKTAASANEASIFSRALGSVANTAEKAAQGLSDYLEARSRIAKEGGFFTFGVSAKMAEIELERIKGVVSSPLLSGSPGLPGAGPTETEIRKLEKSSADLQKRFTATADAANKLAREVRLVESESRNAQGLHRMALDAELLAASSSKATEKLQKLMVAAQPGSLSGNLQAGSIDPELLTGGPGGIVSQGVSQGIGFTLGNSILGNLSTTLKSDLGPTMMAAITGGGSKVEAAGSLVGTSLTKTIGAKIAGSALAKGGGLIGSIIGKVGSFIPVIGPLIGPAITGITKLFGKMFGGEGKKVNDLRDQAIEAAGGFDVLNKKAHDAGFNLDKLLSAKKVKDFDAAMADLNAKLGDFASDQEADAQRLTAAIQKYAFSFEQLGPALQKQNLDGQAKELIEDWRVLVGAGIDMGTVNERMSESINEFLQTAIKVGAEVPAAMRPILQKMLEQGTLTDEAGNAITDMEAAGIHFSETMTEGFDRVVTKLTELIEKLGLAGDAIGNLPSVPDVTSATGAGAENLTGFASGTRGRFLNFGAGTPVMLHGRERVSTAAEGAADAASLAGVQSEVAGLRGDMARLMRTIGNQIGAQNSFALAQRA